MYWDPTGHVAVGDEYYDEETQAKIAAATDAYYVAYDKGDAAGMAAAHAAAEQARQEGTKSVSNE